MADFTLQELLGSFGKMSEATTNKTLSNGNYLQWSLMIVISADASTVSGYDPHDEDQIVFTKPNRLGFIPSATDTVMLIWMGSLTASFVAFKIN